MRYDPNMTEEQNAEQERFMKYMKQVDVKLILLCGMPSDCLEDYSYWDCFAAKVSPLATAKRALKYNGF
jgi:hypothetical protein